MTSPPFLVVDASVAVKWILPEPGHQQAQMLQDWFQDEKLDLLALCLLVSEVGNVLWKRVGRGELEPETAQICFEEFLLNCPILVDSVAASRSALRLALAHQHSPRQLSLPGVGAGKRV
ncbi:MAG: hypothetical protein Kow001_25310 [Acidobacteriota bacterium]